MALIVNYNEVIKAERHSVVTTVQKSVTLFNVIIWDNIIQIISGKIFFCLTNKTFMLTFEIPTIIMKKKG